MRPSFSSAATVASVLFSACALPAADQPQWGQAWTRNMVSAERGLPDSSDPKTGQNVRWSAALGTETYSTPIVANGRVFIGTNNEQPRDPKHQGDRGVFMCFDEKDGHLLWQFVVRKREEDIYHDWPKTGMSSPATVEGDRVYLVNNRGEVVCLDAKGMGNGNDGPFLDEGRHMTPIGTNAPAKPLTPGPLDADVIWLTDLTKDVGIWSHDGAHSSILIHGDHLYLNTGTGVDNTHRKIRTPDAPSLVVLDKRTGRLLARDDEHIAPDIFHCTWSSPALAKVDGRELVFFAGGNGVLYAFEPLVPERVVDGKTANISAIRDSNPPVPSKLKKVWQFDCDPAAPKGDVHRFTSNRREGPSNIFGMPVFVDGRIYLAGGGDWWWGKNDAWLKCIDARGSGDITATNQVWTHALGRHTMSTPAVADGLVYASDTRLFQCVEAETGKVVWTQELKGDIWASALVADGKVFIGSRRGDFWVFAHGREKKVLNTIELGSPVNATATAANGTLYVATMKVLYALGR
jgi:outer membrane protein assembly factor BamB